MPRLARLDAPGVMHHVIGRGIERRKIFFKDRDREDFVGRLGELAEKGAWAVYAWVLMPNHYHLLIKTKKQPLAGNMRKLLTGYVVNFNHRYKRAGHLFQNRYKSIWVLSFFGQGEKARRNYLSYLVVASGKK
jgi:putative transposase